MRTTAAVYRGNKTFTVEEVTIPPPGPGQVQIDVAYCGICGTDLHIYLGHMDPRVGFERTIGHEMSGVISALGADVSGLSVEQHVVVRPLDHCGSCPACKAGHQHICHTLTFIGIDSDGAFQEKWNVPAHTIHVMPDDLDLSHAALIEPLAVACHDIRRGQFKPGEDYEQAMELLARGVVDCDAFITDIQGLADFQSAIEALTQNPNAMKSMIRISEDKT